jgi:polyisoprenoid-binding protein YceI
MSWKIDPAHSQVQFTVRHMMISNVRGRFENFTGTVEFDEQNPARSKFDAQIEAASINTKEPNRDAHLRSPDFLNADQYPHLHFKSKRAEMLDAAHGRIVGDLTIRDITREVVLDVDYAGQAKSPYGTVSAGFSAQTKINRTDWGLNWNVALETGGWLVGEEVTINLELEIVKQAEAVGQPEAVAA